METAKMLKKIKNPKMIIAGYSPNRNWLNLIGATENVNIFKLKSRDPWFYQRRH
jgi:hypothetical protein